MPHQEQAEGSRVEVLCMVLTDTDKTHFASDLLESGRTLSFSWEDRLPELCYPFCYPLNSYVKCHTRGSSTWCFQQAHFLKFLNFQALRFKKWRSNSKIIHAYYRSGLDVLYSSVLWMLSASLLNMLSYSIPKIRRDPTIWMHMICTNKISFLPPLFQYKTFIL